MKIRKVHVGILGLGLVVMATALSCSPRTDPGPPSDNTPPTVDGKPGWFRDITPNSGVSLTYRNGNESNRFTILESLGGGVAMIDYDGDGLIDLFFPGGGGFSGPDNQTIVGLPPKLYRNRGKGAFEDVTAKVGLDRLANDQPWFYNHGTAVADFDRDGFPDLLMTGYGRVALWHNESDGQGGRRFREVTQASGLLGPHFWSSSAAFGDLDGDGYPDLYLCQYVNWSNANDPPCPGYFPGIARDVCPPRQYDSVPHALFRNRGDGTFENVSVPAGIRCNRPDKNYGKGLGVLFVDVDLDGKPDIYVANDTTENFLYLNKSTPGKLRFEEVGAEYGVHIDDKGKCNGSMGLDATDYDGSGRPSIWVTNYENELHALYRNMMIKDRMAFLFSTSPAGLAAIGNRYVGFGTGFIDIDRDGWEDIIISNGHVMIHHPQNFVAQPPVIFLNTPRGKDRLFKVHTDDGGPYFRQSHIGRGMGIGDLDNDGRQDLVMCRINAPAVLLRNEAAPEHHWLGVELIGVKHSDVTGARIKIETSGRTLTRFVNRGRSYLTHSDQRIVAGLGDAVAPVNVTVEWPSGSPRTERFTALPADRYHRLEQGRGSAK